MTRIAFKLPGIGKWKVDQDDKISAGQVIGEKKNEGIEKTLPLAKLLKVPPGKIGKLVVKKVGDKISAGEPLAQKTTLLKKIKVFSPFEGRLARIDETKGNLIIETEEEWEEVVSDVSGTVKKVSQDLLEIEFEGEVLPAIRSAGKKTSGKINYSDKKIGVSDLDKENKGEIICAREGSLAAFEKALALEVSGLVLTQISDDDLEKVDKGKTWEIGESCFLSLPLLIIEEAEFAKLKNHQGEKAILNPEEKRLVICL